MEEFFCKYEVDMYFFYIPQGSIDKINISLKYLVLCLVNIYLYD